MTRLEEIGQAVGAPVAPPVRRRRRRWPWIAGSVVLILGVAVAVMWLSASRAIPVTMGQAESRLGTSVGDPSDGSLPSVGVYAYRGSGTDRLSFPPLSQPEGPTMPGTVTLEKGDCWTFRIDYSTHHWESWDYCLRHGALQETGGRVWQLWSVGPIEETNLTTIRCTAGTMAVPAGPLNGKGWASRCVGVSSAVKGRMVSAGPYRYQGEVTVVIGGTPVRALRFLGLRTDSGAQRGKERTEMWLDARNGLPLRVQQDIRVATATPFGTSVYTQTGVATLVSLVPRR